MPDEVIYFVSDTHLGDGTGADRFRYPDQLMGLLRKIQSEPEAHLVLLGDFMELWATSLEPVLIKHAPIFFMLGQLAATHPITYVVGNHDCLPWYYFVGQGTGTIRIVEEYTPARSALLALHGHQFDPFNQINITGGHVKVPWTRRLVQAVGFIGRFGGDKAGDAVADAGTALEKAATTLEAFLPDWDPTAHRNMSSFLSQARRVLEHESPGERGYPAGERVYEEAAGNLMRRGARLVVMGHTHHPLVRRFGNRTYVNTGSWVWDRYPPTYARYSRGQLELLEANTHKPYAPPSA
ncbi:MAG TPA: UDP-2,3-diacylglucosamine diphosphatase [Symbiobacteriaceae bacterium]|nr:UDP-2,3-diacylglucosamine diphosphatase [Symbiobacteriaceae bacterium]